MQCGQQATNERVRDMIIDCSINTEHVKDDDAKKAPLSFGFIPDR